MVALAVGGAAVVLGFVVMAAFIGRARQPSPVRPGRPRPAARSGTAFGEHLAGCPACRYAVDMPSDARAAICGAGREALKSDHQETATT